MPKPILVIDHGYAVAKACLFEDDALTCFKVPLGYKASEHLSVLDSIIHIIQSVEQDSKINILNKDKKPNIPIFVSGEIASTELKSVLQNLPIGTVEALEESGFNVIDVGSTFTFLKIAHSGISSESMQRGMVNRERVSASLVSRWLPFKTSLGDVENYLRNKELYLQIVPKTLNELHLEQAAAREKLRLISDPLSSKEQVFNESFNPTEIVLSGGVLSLVSKYSQAVHVFLDGVNLSGVYRLYLDKDQIVTCLGTLKRFNQERARGFISAFNFTPLGTAICLEDIYESQETIKVMIDLGLKNPQEMLVNVGDILLFPLATGETAEINLEISKKRKISFEVEGGEVGVVIDARGRPFERPPFGSVGWQYLEKWDKQMNAHGQVEEI